MTISDRSACHNATVTVGGDDIEGTHYYICSKCNNPCDRAVTHNELDRILGEIINCQKMIDFGHTGWEKYIEQQIEARAALHRLILKQRREAEIQGLSMAHYCVEDGSPEEKRINNAIKALEAEAHLAEIEGSNHG